MHCDFENDGQFKFSVLLSIYINSCASELTSALLSIFDSFRCPDQVVVVIDGIISDEVEIVLSRFSSKIVLVRLENNVGLGLALNIGLKHCIYPWVARFDSDDICTPQRFLRQIEYIEQNPSVDIVGGWIDEFEQNVNYPVSVRRVPCSHKEIIDYAKWRNPFNHMTVMFRKEFIDSIGGYRDCYLYEDYDLWMRAIAEGATLANIDEILVHARVGSGMIERRGGVKYILSEQKALHSFFMKGYLSYRVYFISAIVRLCARLSLKDVRKFIYRNILR